MITRVFILYTGGTIGMVPSVKDIPFSPLRPAGLEELLNFMPRFTSDDIGIPTKTKSTVAKTIAQNNTKTTQKATALQSDKKRIANDKTQVPCIELENGNVIMLGSDSFEEPVDSSNVEPDHWHEMAQRIAKVYDDYDGFVILHGTDTMAYTSSALSFLFENLAKPVVITGSQLPIANMRTDAVINFMNAIHIAGYRATDLPLVPEVVIAFADKIIRGCRASKISTTEWAGFHSPNFPLLGTIGEHIKINTHLLLPMPASNKRFGITPNVIPRVSFITLFPGFSQSQIQASLDDEESEGYILCTYGTGNVPNKQVFLDAIEKAVSKGKIIVNVTQCLTGSVRMGLYATGNSLLERGVISGLDMTPEAAVIKMMWTLRFHEREERTTQMQINQRGEQTESLFDLCFGELQIASNEYITCITLDDRIKNNRISNAMLRMYDFTVECAQENTVYELRVFMHMSNSNNEASAEKAHCVAVLYYSFSSGEPSKQTLMHNITDECQNIVGDGNMVVKVVSTNPDVKFTFRGLCIALYAHV